MRRGILCLLALAANAHADWTFAPALRVTTATTKVFHHLESAGSKNIAVNDTRVAVIWEDNRSGAPQIYVAFKAPSANTFGGEQRLSNGGEAYEPAIVALAQGRFAYAWQQDSAIHLRIGDSNSGGEDSVLSTNGQQATLATRDGRQVYVAWSEGKENTRRIRWTRFNVDACGVARIEPARTLAAGASGDQLYPALAISSRGHAYLLWEDRRAGHTRLWASDARDGVNFSTPQAFNETVRRSAVFGRGNGVARPTLTSYGKRGIAAVWLDKRNFQSGYDVYASVNPNDDGRFAPNTLVIDDFGENIAQWHAASAGAADTALIALWDDERDDSADVFFSEFDGKSWGTNQAIPVASGPGEQTNPSAVFDAAGYLHVAWLERNADGTNEIRYSRAARQRQ